MGLEVATYISDLNVANPVGASDPKSQGDDHIRLIKTTIKNTFPNINGAVTLTDEEINGLNSKASVEARIMSGPGGIAPLVNVPAVNADWNTTTAAGWFVDQRAAGSANAPEAGSAWMGLNIWTEDANNLVQLAIPDVLNTAQAKGLYMRSRSAGTWGAWRHIIFEGDITTLITAINTAALLFTNKSLEDATVFIVDNVDNTKKVRFEVSGVTTGVTRVLTVPNFDGTLATLAGAETLTNKALNGSLGATTPSTVAGTTGSFSSNLSSGGTITANQNIQSSTAALVLGSTGAGNVYQRPNGVGSSTGEMRLSSDGILHVATDVAVASDKRLKKFIKKIDSKYATEAVKKIRGVSFTRKRGNLKGIGFIAQEVQEFFPELVHTENNGKLSLAYPNMVAILWETVKSLQAKVEELEAK